jgi:hypothetical protein
VLVGLAVHLATAGGLATLFALLVPRRGPTLVVPFASPPLDREAPHGAFLLVHLAFGASLSAGVPARRLGATLDRMRRTLRGTRHALV